ncbi:hypothetical protein C8Q79DRAFT_1012052 [Trametes meyenii]|nr:hypothetical protein C8Q79DRAFT_1012052 [Trametes meyenii]
MKWRAEGLLPSAAPQDLVGESSDDAIPPHIGRLLVKIFRNFVAHGRLRNLTIKHAEEFLLSDLELTPTVSRLCGLKSLVVTSAGAQCFELLRTLRASLVELSIHVSAEFARDLSEDALDGALIPSRLTLQTARLANWHFPWPYGLAFPLVTLLALTHVVDAQPSDYLRAFPNLQELRISRSSKFLGERRYDNGRCASLRLLTRRVPGLWAPWTSLEHFVGCTSVLAGLPILTELEIPSLSLREDRMDSERVNGISSFLWSARPTHLQLHLTGGDWLLDNGVLADVYRERPLQYLQSLFVSVSSGEDEEDLDLVSALDNIVKRVLPKLSSLVSFDLHISGSWEYVEFNTDPRHNHTIAKEWSLDEIARFFLSVGQSESLNSVGISLDSPQLGDIPPARVGFPYTPAFRCESDEHELDEDSEGDDYSVNEVHEMEDDYELVENGGHNNHIGDGVTE